MTQALSLLGPVFSVGFFRRVSSGFLRSTGRPCFFYGFCLSAAPGFFAGPFFCRGGRSAVDLAECLKICSQPCLSGSRGNEGFFELDRIIGRRGRADTRCELKRYLRIDEFAHEICIVLRDALSGKDRFCATHPKIIDVPQVLRCVIFIECFAQSVKGLVADL